MRTINSRSLFFFAGLLALTGCSTRGVRIDEAIDSGIRSEIGKLNHQIMKGLVTHDPEKVRALGSEKLRLDQKNNVWAIVEQPNNIWDSLKFKIKNQFYVINPTAGEEAQVMTGSGDHDYGIRFPSDGKEAFVIVGYFTDTIETFALTTIYTRVGDQWKLDLIQIGLLEILGRDAWDWYRKAKENIQKGYIVDAVSSLTLSSRCLKPANQLWYYQKEKEISDFRATLQNKINTTYTFPLAVNGVTSKPQIFKLFPQGTDVGYYPMIFYETRLNLSDTTALSNECNEIHRRIGDVFKGLDKNNTFILYRAFGKAGTSKEQVSHGFIRKVE